MKISSVWFTRSVRMAILVAIWHVRSTAICADASVAAPAVEPFNYAEPKLLTATIFEIDSAPRKVLFTFHRTAMRSGRTVRVERTFNRPDGSVAAVENIVYESGRLVSYDMKELQAGLWGNIRIKPDSTNPARQKVLINHGSDSNRGGKGTELDLPNDTLIDDTVYPFILAHWEELMQGKTVRCRFVSLQWERAFGFKLVKATEAILNGRQLVRIKMEAASLLVARFMEPIYFSIEKAGAHRIVEYVGRTTPRVKKGKAWKYLNAQTVFDQK